MNGVILFTKQIPVGFLDHLASYLNKHHLCKTKCNKPVCCFFSHTSTSGDELRFILINAFAQLSRYCQKQQAMKEDERDFFLEKLNIFGCHNPTQKKEARRRKQGKHDEFSF